MVFLLTKFYLATNVVRLQFFLTYDRENIKFRTYDYSHKTADYCKQTIKVLANSRL